MNRITHYIKPPEPKQRRQYHISWMIRRDMERVLSIESDCFGDHAWPENEFIRWLRQRNCIGMVAESGKPKLPQSGVEPSEVVGFMLYELHKNRLHLINFAVDPFFHRRGVGWNMVSKLKSKLDPKRRSRIVVDVRETNLEAQLFFRAAGFRAISVLRDHYETIDEDAYLFQYRCDQ